MVHLRPRPFVPRIALALLAAAVVGACGDGGTTITAPIATTLTKSTGDSLTIAESTPHTLVVIVYNQSGNAMAGVPVTWTITAGEGTLDSTTTTTNSNGQATVTYTAGADAGTATITATVASLPVVTFTETVIPPIAVGAVNGYTQTGGLNSSTNQRYTSSKADESAVAVSGAGDLTLVNVTVIKAGGNASDTTASGQHGVDAGVLAAGASRITIGGGSISTSATGSSGLFATDAGSFIEMANGTITTAGEASRGVDATLGGAITLTGVGVVTAGSAGSAGLATGTGGTVTLGSGTVTTAGAGSPAILSAGSITATNATLTANGGDGVVVDGAGTVTLVNSTLTGERAGVRLTRSAAGSGTASVTVAGGSLTSGTDAFDVAAATGSTTAAITLKGGATVVAASGVLLNVTAASNATLAADGESLTGSVVADSTSTVAVVLTNGSTLTGPVQRAALTLDASSAWHVTGGSALTSLTGAKISGNAITNIVGNGYTVTYDASLAANAPLGGQTYLLASGGVLAPR